MNIGSYVCDLCNPFIYVSSEGITGQADLDGSSCHLPEMNVSIRIPLKAYGCALQLRLPDVLRLVQFGVVGGQNRVIECPLKAHVCDVDCQNPFPS